MERIALDVLGPLPLSIRGNKYIMVVCDYFTRWSEAYGIPNQEALTVAKTLVVEWICRCGAPELLSIRVGDNQDTWDSTSQN